MKFRFIAWINILQALAQPFGPQRENGDNGRISSTSTAGNLRAPFFTQTPPDKLNFSNSTGASLSCSARGTNPLPQISWVSHDGRTIQTIPGVVEVSANGTIIFPPFPPHLYDTTIHDAILRCQAKSPVGTLMSNPVQVRGVVVGDYEVQVYDQLIMVGNTGFLRCSVPSYVMEYVTVTSWVHDSAFNIYPSLHGDGKYQMTPTGELLVLNVSPQDGHSRFQCRTLHKLTGATQLSRTPARIIVTEPHGSVPPRISERTTRVRIEAGRDVMLPCVAQGHPPPQYNWYHSSSPIQSSERSWIVGGSLVLVGVTEREAGEYHCVANNSAGLSRYTMHLDVSTPLSVQVTPTSIEVDSGKDLGLRCHISGNPIESIKWLKDGRPLQSSSRVKTAPRESLFITGVSKEDSGVYQCEVSSGESYASGHSYVSLGAEAPSISYRFISQTLQPGPAVSLKCIASGTPTPHVTWTLDGFPLPQSHRFMIGQYVSGQGDVISHVNISSVRVSDGGMYRCEASNTAGSVYHNARLNIYGPPQVRPMGSLSAIDGEDFSVTCPVGGHPIDKIIWKKDRIRLPSNHRQKVFANGTLTVRKVSKNSDGGTYSCTAFDRQERFHTQTLILSVIVPPRMAPIYFPEGTRAGMRAQVTCLVQEGDQPISLSWQKDGYPISPLLDLSISHLDPFASILVVKNASDQHTGNYSCIASNPVGKTTQTASLVVRVPPRWVTEPSGGSVSLGGKITLECLAKGFPDPKITWRKETVSREFVTINTDHSMGMRAWDNGTLTISRAERRHEGRYLCEANNGVGGGLSKVISLQVNEPPWFALRSQRLQVEVDSLVKLTCQAKGDPPLNLIWTRDGAPLPPYPRYEVSEKESNEGASSELLIRRGQVQDSGVFVCEASNPHGTLTSDFNLIVQDVPDSPSGLTVTEDGSRHLSLSWTPPSDSNAPITAYIVSYAAQNSKRNGVQQHLTIDGEKTTVKVEGLDPATSYVFSVSAENRVGRSPPSVSVRHSTLEEVPKGYPQNIRVNSISSTALQVTWDPPMENETHGLILGYYLGYKVQKGSSVVTTDTGTNSGTGAYNFTTVGVEGLGVTSATLTSLRPFTNYSVVLQAFNSRGAGPSSPPTIAETLEDKPNASPTHISCHALTSSQLRVTWSPPPDRDSNGIIISYKLIYRLENPKEERENTGIMVSETTEATLTELEPWSNYSVMITASTRAGEGTSSEEVVCKTLEDVPDGPKVIKAVPSGSLSATVSWSVPDRPNGHLVGYTVFWKAQNSRSRIMSRYIEAPQTHLTLHDLKSTSYEIWVTASTSVGKGPSSIKTQVTVSPSRAVGAGIWSVGGNLTVGWKDDVLFSCRAVGNPDPEIMWSHRGKTITKNRDRFSILPDGTLRIVDTQKTDTGTYICIATNIHGSDKVIYNLKILVPPTQPSLHITETTSSSIRLQWSVEDDGGAPIRRSNLFYRRHEGETKEVIVQGSLFSHTVGDLECGTKYQFFLTTTNRIGTSDASREVEATTKGRPPEAPPSFQFVTTNSTQATLYLTQWESGGCPITHFLIQYRRAGISVWTTVGSEILPSRTFAVPGLASGVKYDLRVKAYNAAGTTHADYHIRTPSSDIGYGAKTISDDSWSVTHSGNGGTFAPFIWRDPRIIVPLVISFSAFVLIFVTICICIRKRPQSNDIKKEHHDQSPCRITKDMMENQHTYSPIRRLVTSTPKAPPPSEARDSTGDYSEEDTYQYASATYQIRKTNTSPPPPTPPSPPNPHDTDAILAHAQKRHQHPKGFSAIVYQPPSLHDVDAPNVGNCRSGDSDIYPGGDLSETDEYGSIADGEGNKQRPQRGSRNRNQKSKHFIHRMDCGKNYGGLPTPSHITFRPKARLPTPMPIPTDAKTMEGAQTKPECDIHWRN